jgi:hypothetical protein
MFGTPAIILEENISEFVVDGNEVAVVQDNTSYEQISAAVQKILSNYTIYSNAARKCFLENFLIVHALTK